MANGIYIGVGGVAKKVNKMYVGVNGVARKVKKAYIGVNNIARLFYTSGVRWVKYNCTSKNTTTYVQNTTSGSSYRTGTNAGDYTFYTDYGFSSSSGFYGWGATEFSTSFFPDISGYYDVGTYYVRYITKGFTNNTANNNGKFSWRYDYNRVGDCDAVTTTTYTKGSTSYGELFAPDGELPESGTLLSGSATGTYCVLNIGGTLYYYVKET